MWAGARKMPLETPPLDHPCAYSVGITHKIQEVDPPRPVMTSHTSTCPGVSFSVIFCARPTPRILGSSSIFFLWYLALSVVLQASHETRYHKTTGEKACLWSESLREILCVIRSFLFEISHLHGSKGRFQS